MSQATDMKHKQQVIKVQQSLLNEITEYINILKNAIRNYAYKYNRFKALFFPHNI